MIPLEKCNPSSSHEEDRKPDGPLSQIRSGPAMGSRHRPSAAQMFCFYIPQLIYAIIIAGVNIPSDSR